MKLNVIWDIRARIDTMTEEMIIKLAQAGCSRIHYGVETATLAAKVIRKNLDLKKSMNIAFTKTRYRTLGYS